MGTATANSERQHGEIVQIGNAILIHGDNKCINPTFLQYLKTEYGVNIHDLGVVSDPPYGIKIQTDYSHNGKRPYGAFKPLHEGEIDHDPTPWLSIGNFQLFWGANHYANKLPHNGRWLVWDKRCQVVPSRNQADCEMAWCSDYGAARMFYHLWDGFMRDSEQGEDRVHPTQKPIAVMNWCMQFCENETILDPYMGSGTTGVAALQNNRMFIGVEYDREYFEAACLRLAKLQSCKLPEHLNTQQQVDMFV